VLKGWGRGLETKERGGGVDDDDDDDGLCTTVCCCCMWGWAGSTTRPYAGKTVGYSRGWLFVRLCANDWVIAGA
jgi:hypothetical protein